MVGGAISEDLVKVTLGEKESVSGNCHTRGQCMVATIAATYELSCWYPSE